MIKKILFSISLFLLTNCALQTSSILGPIYTGAKTGSIYQSGLSYSSGKLINEIKSFKIPNKSHTILSNEKLNYPEPKILLSYVVDPIIFSDVLEPEPLP